MGVMSVFFANRLAPFGWACYGRQYYMSYVGDIGTYSRPYLSDLLSDLMLCIIVMWCEHAYCAILSNLQSD